MSGIKKTYCRTTFYSWKFNMLGNVIETLIKEIIRHNQIHNVYEYQNRFQEDGGPSHDITAVREYLNKRFSRR